jgi:hypothetical protein
MRIYLQRRPPHPGSQLQIRSFSSFPPKVALSASLFRWITKLIFFSPQKNPAGNSCLLDFASFRHDNSTTPPPWRPPPLLPHQPLVNHQPRLTSSLNTQNLPSQRFLRAHRAIWSLRPTHAIIHHLRRVDVNATGVDFIGNGGNPSTLRRIILVRSALSITSIIRGRSPTRPA